jgi:hypothetical protein
MRRQKAPPFPPIPCEVYSAFGPIVVELVEDLRAPEDPTERLFGYWNPFTRVISIRANLHPAAAWLTLHHEKTHADLSEIGVTLSTDQEEAVCNAIAQARVSEMLARP